MNFLNYIQLHGLTRTAKLLSKSISTIQSWKDSGKTYEIKLDEESQKFYAWERKG